MTGNLTGESGMGAVTQVDDFVKREMSFRMFYPREVEKLFLHSYND
jgi:hypothetical protein